MGKALGVALTNGAEPPGAVAEIQRCQHQRPLLGRSVEGGAGDNLALTGPQSKFERSDIPEGRITVDRGGERNR